MGKLYQIWAGEGEVLRYVTETDSLTTARRLLTQESEGGTRNIMLKMRTETGEYMRIDPYDPDLPASQAARALRAIPSERRSEQSRINGRKGGRPPKRQE